MQSLVLAEMEFNPNLQYGYKHPMSLEPDLELAVEAIKWCDHMVWFHPIWWYGYPALMKGFIDRTFLPGIAFQYQEGKPLPKKLLKGKSARIITTADTPVWYYRWWMNNPTTYQLKRGTLQFSGINPVKTTYFGPVRGSTSSIRAAWLEKVRKLGMQGK